MSAPNLARTLHELAFELPDRIGYTFLDEHGQVADRWSFSDLDRRASAVAAALSPVTQAGDRALLLFPSGLDFVAGFYGALRAGVVAVPASPPNPDRAERTLPRLLALVAAARPSAVLTVSPLARAARRFADLAPELLRVPWISVDALPDAPLTSRSAPDGLAFLQYTSGSTSTPKGVRVSHANLAEQMRTFSLKNGFGRHTVFGSWLPIHHDMGLIGKLLTPAWYGAHTVFMAPGTFLRRPALWPRMMSDHQASVSAAPDFAYALCAARTRPEEKAGLDLSGWRQAMNGAEPIRARTLDAFTRAFAECGLRPEALNPCYGLAEATLQVTGAPVGQLHRRLRLDPAALRAGRAVVVPEGGAEQVSSGSPLPDLLVDVVGPEGGSLPDGQVGEIRVRGGTVAEGYWGDEQAFSGGLYTGDLGFFDEGDLFVVGRVKDLLILGGANHYPQDIERCVEGCHPAVRLGQVAAFALDTDDGEVVGLAIEVSADDDTLCPTIRRAVADGAELTVHTIGLLPPGALPKTTSGKIQRFQCAEGIRAGTLPFLRIDRLPTPAQAPTRREGELLEWLLGRIAASGGAPSVSESFVAQGIDSRKGMELLAELEARLGRTIPTELLYRHPTPARLAQALEPGASEERGPEERRAPTSPSAAVGVLGMAARLPGAARLDDLWEVLRAGRCAVGPAPAGRSGARDAGWLADVDGFDHAAFKISAAEAAEMDPHQRLLLEVTWEALADAGLAPEALEGREVGVFVGLSGAHPALPTSPSPWTATGGSAAIAANRISYLLDLRGPSMAVDTACSSGLSALHLAVAALRSGEIELAVVAAANLLLDEALSDALAAAGFLAPRCRVFDAEANGYVRGEGVVVVVLGSDGPGVRARILGSAQGQDGRSNGLTAPNPAAQEAVIRRAWANAGCSPGDAAAFELHGTGTVIGDPIEAQALARVVPGGPFLVGAVKAALGHLEAAAGLAGLAKVVLAMEHAFWPPQPLLDTPNPRIPWDRLRVSAGEAWAPGPVGLSAFSFGGSNVHVVVAPPHAPRRPPAPAPRWTRADAAPLPAESSVTPEEQVVAVLREVLGGIGLEEPTPSALLTTPLDTLGLDSMLAMGLAARLERDLGIVVPVEQLLAGVTGAGLIGRITGGTFEPPGPFPERLVEAVRARAEVVVTDEDGALTGAALAEAILQLAARLAQAGVVAGDRVGVVLPRGRQTLVALGAIGWLGAAWVPADPTWPRARREEVLRDAGARVLVGEGGLPALGLGLLTAEPPPPAAGPDGLAYILYTSGSTGRPKGVAVSHRALSTNLASLERALGLRAPRWLSVTSLAFDISIAELLLPLLAGGTLHLVSDTTARDGLRLRARVEAIDPDWLQATPGTWRMLLNAGWAGSPRISAISGGETLPRPLADALRERCAALWNAYGPTEATIWAMLAAIDGDVTIGRPLPGYHLRQQGEELWIGGPALAEGYWRDPERTAAAFVTQGGARWYRTGDAVELLPDGRWSYRGRLDQQIKVHGARVEPGEVEAALVTLPGVREAVVRPHRGALVAFVTGSLPADANAQLAARLPAHMVPSRFVVIEALPRLVSGKIDLGALVPPDEALATTDTGAEPAEVVLLAGLWSEVLLVPASGDTDFFAAGGDSILATALMLRVRAVLGREVPFHGLTEAPTPRALFAWMARPDATQVELEADIHLDASILPGPRLEVSTGEVFFTGATGFLGRVILRRLLDATPWTLHCLVRADSPEEGLRRLGPPHPRLRAVCGDLTKPGLGMDARDRARIADSTESVIHNGALVNFVFPYRAMRAANVLGTAEVIALAALGRSKHLHHVSTVAVFESEGYAEVDEVGEDADLRRSTGLWDGYPQSKWVSERLVWEAAARGLSVSVHRPGMVTGTSAPSDDDPHALNPDDFIFRMIRGCALLGVVPELDTLVELVPVDYVADSFVALAANAPPGVWHLTNPHPLHCDDFIAALGRLGYPMRRLPWAAWREEVLRRLEPQNPLFPLIPFFATRRDPRSMRLPLFGTARTRAALGDRVTPCPPVGEELLGRYLGWMERRGLLLKP